MPRTKVGFKQQAQGPGGPFSVLEVRYRLQVGYLKGNAVDDAIFLYRKKSIKNRALI